MKKEISITGWDPGFKKVSFNSMLRTYCNLSLGDTKRLVDGILEGQHFTIEVEENFAENFLSEARKAGAFCNYKQ